MLIARKPLSIGPFVLAAGEEVTQEMVDLLPAGRVIQMKDHGFLDERVDNQELIRMVQDLEARVARLEAHQPEPPRRGRPPKAEEF